MEIPIPLCILLWRGRSAALSGPLRRHMFAPAAQLHRPAWSAATRDGQQAAHHSQSILTVHLTRASQRAAAGNSLCTAGWGGGWVAVPRGRTALFWAAGLASERQAGEDAAGCRHKAR